MALQIPSYQMAPDIDFATPLSRLGQAYETNQQRSRLSELGRGLADGTIDYRQAASAAADMGDIGSSMRFLAMDEEQKKLARAQAASDQFAATMRGVIGGQPQQPQPFTGPLSAPVAPARTSNSLDRIYSENEPSPLDPPSGRDRDLAVRTIVAESGNQPAIGQTATASVIRNRAGNGGLTPSQVVQAPNQFEPWNTPEGRAKMAAIDPNSPEYKAADSALTRAYFGDDPTNGATMFYAPKAQAALGRPAPAWDNGKGVDIGDHRFFGGAPTGQPGPYQVAQAGSGIPAPPSGTPTGAQQPVAATPSVPGTVGMKQVPLLMQAISNPYLPANEKDIAKLFLTRALDDAKPSDKIKTLNELKNASGYKGTILELEKELRASSKPEVNVNTKGETKFEETLGAGQAKRFNDLIEAGVSAQRKMVDINNMREISTRMGSQGAAANIKEALGPYAEALDINLDGLSDIQAYSSIVQRLAPQQRAPGSGSTSDIEYKGFLKSLPTLSQNPGAREATLNTMEALTRDEIARGEIASRLASGEIKRADAEKELRALPDPMKAFTEWRKANPELYGQARRDSAAGRTQPAPGSERSPPSGDFEEPKLAPDGNKYIKRNGQYFRVVQ